MMQIVEEAEPPVRLPLGTVAIGRIRGKLDTVREEIAKWEGLAAGTDFS